MLQCYVLTCGRSVTAFLASPRSQRPGQGPRSPHPKVGPGSVRNISGKVLEKVKTHILHSIMFLRKLYFSWDKVEECDRAGESTDKNIIRQMCFSCWVTSYRHELRVCNTYCFLKTIVMWTHLNITFSLHCQYCSELNNVILTEMWFSLECWNCIFVSRQ
jgi:hypothetical protein